MRTQSLDSRYHLSKGAVKELLSKILNVLAVSVNEGNTDWDDIKTVFESSLGLLRGFCPHGNYTDEDIEFLLDVVPDKFWGFKREYFFYLYKRFPFSIDGLIGKGRIERYLVEHLVKEGAIEQEHIDYLVGKRSQESC